MKEFTIGQNDAGQRLDRFLAKAVPLLPASLAQKYIRIKRIKCNGKRIDRDTRLQEGDVLQLYINDEFFDNPREDNAYLTVANPNLNIVYEDENILLVDKRPGLAVHPHDGAEYGRTLIDHIQSYLYQKREWRPREENAFTPALCNRIDRNTGGIVIAAKTAEALRVMNQKIKDREIDKRYLAIVEGTPKPKEGSLKGYLFKDAQKNRVYVTDTPQPGSKTCQTNYKTLATAAGLFPGGVRADHRPHASDPRPVRPCGTPPAGGRQVRQAGQALRPELPGAVFLQADLHLHHGRRVAGLSEWQIFSGGKGGFRGAVFSQCENMKMASRTGCHLAYFKGLAEERCKGKTVSF